MVILEGKLSDSSSKQSTKIFCISLISTSSSISSADSGISLNSSFCLKILLKVVFGILASAFNLLDARHAISVTERQRYILRVRALSKACAQAYYDAREKLGFPLCKNAQKLGE